MSEQAPTEPTDAIVKSVVSDYAILSGGVQRLPEIIRANAGTVGMSEFDLDTVTMPTGGGTAWTVPSLEGDQMCQAITGVVVAFKDSRAYWEISIDDGGGGSPPDCSSDDCITGIGNPGGACAGCPLAQFGSEDGGQGRGQSCKQMRILFVIRQGDILPLRIVLPPSSLAPIRKFFLRLTANALPYYAVAINLALARAKNKDGINYAVVVPTMAGKLALAEVEQFRRLAQELDPVFRKSTIRNVTGQATGLD